MTCKLKPGYNECCSCKDVQIDEKKWIDCQTDCPYESDAEYEFFEDNLVLPWRKNKVAVIIDNKKQWILKDRLYDIKRK